ncbi:60S ribosomal protein L7a [Entamoeba marina]
MSGKGNKSKSVRKVKVTNPLIKPTPKVFGKGHIDHPRDLTRYVKFPLYVRLQRQKRILMKRLKTPPAINIFVNHCLDKSNAVSLFKILDHIKPEEAAARRQRIREKAAQPKKTTKPATLAYGINNVVRLIERKKAKLVCIAHDVVPLEMVVFLPYLCKKLNVPYCIVKGKARLGQLVHRKTAAVVAVTDVKKEDTTAFNSLVENVKSAYFDNAHMYREFGGNIQGFKHNQKQKKIEAKMNKEKADKLKQRQALGLMSCYGLIYNNDELNWDDIEDEWNKLSSERIIRKPTQPELFQKYVSLLHKSVCDRHTIFQIEDSLKYIARSQNEYNLCYWGCLETYRENNSENAYTKNIAHAPLQLPDSEILTFPIILKQKSYKINVEFCSTPILFSDGEFPPSKPNSLQPMLLRDIRFDVHFNGYEYQLDDERYSSMNTGDLFMTFHSNLYYHVIVHAMCGVDHFSLDDKTNTQRFYSNLIFYCHRIKASTLHFYLSDIEDSDDVKKAIVEIFSNIRQSLHDDGFTSISKIVFICAEDICSNSALKAHFNEKVQF